MIRFYHRRPISSSVKFFTEFLSHTLSNLYKEATYFIRFHRVHLSIVIIKQVIS